MGVYVCPRCGSGETYSSEENGRTFALTLDTPSPVDPTILHTMKQEIVRCKKCGEKSNYHGRKASKEEIQADRKVVFRLLFRIYFIVFALIGAAIVYLGVDHALKWNHDVGFQNNGTADLLFWIGLVWLVFAPVLLVRTFVQVTLKTRIILWSIKLVTLIGLASLTWEVDWIRPALLGLGLLALQYIGWLNAVNQRAIIKTIPFTGAILIGFVVLCVIYWPSVLAITFLVLALVAVVLAFFVWAASRQDKKGTSE
jgi:DNA-directed RNA polymerase subunit RPC12/RpoP